MPPSPDGLPTWLGPCTLMEAAALAGVPGDLWHDYSSAARLWLDAEPLAGAPDELVAFCRKREPVKFAEKVARERSARPSDGDAALEIDAARWIREHMAARHDHLKNRLDGRVRILLARDDYRFVGVRAGNLADRVPARLARQVRLDYLPNRIVLEGRGTARPEIWEHITVECLAAPRETAAGDEVGGPDDALAGWADEVCAAVRDAGRRISRDTFVGLALSRFGSGLTVDRTTAAWTKARAATGWPASGTIPDRLKIDEDALHELLQSKGLLRKP